MPKVEMCNRNINSSQDSNSNSNSNSLKNNSCTSISKINITNHSTEVQNASHIGVLQARESLGGNL